MITNLLKLVSALATPVVALSLTASIPALVGNTQAQPTVLAQTAREDSHFTLTNDSSSSIIEFYVEAVNERTRGENLLGQPLDPGESRTITIAAGTTCASNIETVFANGTSRENENVDVCNLGGIAHSD